MPEALSSGECLLPVRWVKLKLSRVIAGTAIGFLEWQAAQDG